MRLRLALIVCLALLASLAVVAPAQATFPGRNGKIAFEHFVEGQNNVYTINPDGSDEKLIATNATGAVWSPDGTQLAFATFAGAPQDEDCFISVMDADGSNLIKITAARTYCGALAWSPDGRAIAFTLLQPGFVRAIAVVNADGSGLREVTEPSFGGPVGASWSPDGTRLVFAGRTGFHEDIWTINVDGTDPTNLTNTPDVEASPAWSPISDKIAFLSAPISEGTPKYAVTLINPDGTGRTKLTSEGPYRSATWSPVDGTQLAFTHWQPGSDEFPFGPYFGVVRVGEPPRRLALGVFPVWSPDGQRLAFPFATSYRSFSLATISLDGTGLTELTDEGFPTDWQPIPFKNRAKQCKAEGKTGRDFGRCVSGKRGLSKR